MSARYTNWEYKNTRTLNNHTFRNTLRSRQTDLTLITLTYMTLYGSATCTYTSLTGNPAEARLRRHETELHVAGGREELGPGRRQHDAVVVGEEASL